VEDALDRLNKHLTSYSQIINQVAQSQRVIVQKAPKWPKEIREDVNRLLTIVDNMNTRGLEMAIATGALIENQEALETVVDKSKDSAQVGRFLRSLLGADASSIIKFLEETNVSALSEALSKLDPGLKKVMKAVLC